jgi:hypothetical protein
MPGDFARKDIHVKVLDLGVDRSTPAGKLVLQIFAALAEYDGTGHPAGKYPGANTGRSVAGQGERETHSSSGRLGCREVRQGQEALDRGLSVAETVSLTGISISIVKRYRKQILKASY